MVDRDALRAQSRDGAFRIRKDAGVFVARTGSREPARASSLESAPVPVPPGGAR
jgi:hypothetical protein